MGNFRKACVLIVLSIYNENMHQKYSTLVCLFTMQNYMLSYLSSIIKFHKTI